MDVVPPYVSNQNSYFWAACRYGDCGKVAKYLFINGEIVGKKPAIRFVYSSQLRSEGGIAEQLATLADEACDAAYRESGRGAAVIWRAAAELLALSGHKTQALDRMQHVPALSQLIKDVRNGRLFPKLKGKDRILVVNSLEFLKDLGDTAAHPIRNPKVRKILSTPSNLDLGKRKLEEAVAKIYRW